MFYIFLSVANLEEFHIQILHFDIYWHVKKIYLIEYMYSFGLIFIIPQKD